MPTLLIAHVAFNVPYVIFNVSPKLRQLDVHLYEAALDLGCDPQTGVLQGHPARDQPGHPLVLPDLLTYSIDDFMISYFNCGTVETLPIAIYSMTRRKVSPEIYALSTIMFAAILTVILVSNAAEGRRYPAGPDGPAAGPDVRGGEENEAFRYFLSALAVAAMCALPSLRPGPSR